MARLFGYHLTWTTYGTWLQGDRRGYVTDGKTLDSNESLLELCRKLQTAPAFRLRQNERKIVETAISSEAERIGHIIHALVVYSNHIHIAARTCDRSIETVVSIYKSAATRALRRAGRTGKIWTSGFHKTYCFTPEELAIKVKYIRKHYIQPRLVSPAARGGGMVSPVARDGGCHSCESRNLGGC